MTKYSIIAILSLLCCIACNKNKTLGPDIGGHDTIISANNSSEDEIPIYCNVMVEKEDVGSWAHILGIKGTKIKYNNNHISLYSKYIPQYIGVIYGDNTLRRFNFEEMEKNVYEAMVEYIPFCKDNIKAIFIVYSNMLSIDDINSLSKKDWLFDAEIETGECANYEKYKSVISGDNWDLYSILYYSKEFRSNKYSVCLEGDERIAGIVNNIVNRTKIAYKPINTLLLNSLATEMANERGDNNRKERQNDVEENNVSESHIESNQQYTPQYETRDEWVNCWDCNGSGNCHYCHGNGTCVSTWSDGSYNSTYQCGGCYGTGRCQQCYGNGGHYEKRTYQVR